MALYYIYSKHAPNKVLDIEGGSGNAGAKLILYAFHGGDNQKFEVSPNGIIRSYRSGLVLDVEGGLGNGHKVIQYTQHNGPNQTWDVVGDQIQVRGQNLVLDINGASTNDGAHIIAYQNHGGTNQRWNLVQVSGMVGQQQQGHKHKHHQKDKHDDDSSSSSEEEKDKAFRSGKWHGHWIQGATRGDMDFKLKFKNGQVTGKGSDQIGKFTWTGNFDSGNKNIFMRKQYEGAHSVDYNGIKCANKQFEGTWAISGGSQGGGSFWLCKGKRGSGDGQSGPQMGIGMGMPPQMGMPQMGTGMGMPPQMGMPQMGIGMGMPPQMGMPQMGTGMGMPQMNMGPGFTLHNVAQYSVPPMGTVSGQQPDAGVVHLAVAHTQWGDIPAKAIGNTCWFPYAGKEHTTSNFSWMVVPGSVLIQNTGSPPPNALAAGQQTDGAGTLWAAIAQSQYGQIPGKAIGNNCWFPYGGQEHSTSNFSWVCKPY